MFSCRIESLEGRNLCPSLRCPYERFKRIYDLLNLSRIPHYYSIIVDKASQSVHLAVLHQCISQSFVKFLRCALSYGEMRFLAISPWKATLGRQGKRAFTFPPGAQLLKGKEFHLRLRSDSAIVLMFGRRDKQTGCILDQTQDGFDSNSPFPARWSGRRPLVVGSVLLSV